MGHFFGDAWWFLSGDGDAMGIQCDVNGILMGFNRIFMGLKGMKWDLRGMGLRSWFLTRRMVVFMLDIVGIQWDISPT